MGIFSDDEKIDTGFLPAVQEVEQTPPSPVGRVIVWAVVFLVVGAVSWAHFSEIDIVSVSRGQLVLSGKGRPVQPVLANKIVKIGVQEGDVVRERDVLVVLDQSNIDVRLKQTNVALESVAIELNRLKAQLGFLNRPYEALAEYNASVSERLKTEHPNLFSSQGHVLTAELNHYASKTYELRKRLLKAEEDYYAYQSQWESSKSILPIIRKQRKSIQSLTKKKLATADALYEVRKTEINALHQVNSSEAMMKSASVEIESVQAQISAYEQSFRTQIVNQINEAESMLHSYSSDLGALELEKSQHLVRASASGVVQQVLHRDKGAFVNQGEVLMVIVPQNEPLYAEVLVQNKDIGFLETGQDVALKLDAFNFTRYGKLTGKLVNISSDAIEHESLGPVYKATVSVQEKALLADGKSRTLEPGMSLTAEIKTGSRDVLSFFTSTIARHLDEAVTVK
ncbi:HlyD family type I secretion periplasmic adaptor subunit [Veronia pacifica]|uniref:Membrane fusion protein (MFP) family protein n=1 Tax=Veronia pacifica TaxID=1080227 RepID=A0A1C3EG77_9GAMM|nr:HlyD family type I secretion periplasmic adaptor subunit [Veronia pacifica]ODA32219.1 hypothetical protein A8L45_13570 [Veronia pacifica]